MSAKVLLIIASRDAATVLTALMFARNAWGGAWFDDVRVVFFGPSERLLVDDDEVAKAVTWIADLCEVYACRAISRREGISDAIEQLGANVVGVGPLISRLINEGYTPMVW
jgi:hypothetical protein